MYKISVVIPTCNRGKLINDTLESLFNNSVLPDEIIIVDQSDNDQTHKALLNYNKILYIKDDFKGAARSRNIGWKQAKSDIVAFTDDDALVERKWIENILKTFSLNNYNTGIVGGKIIPVFNEVNTNWKISDKYRYVLPAYDQGYSIEIYRGGALPPSVNYSIKKELLKSFDGFNENLGPKSGKKYQIFGEDSELSMKVKRSGYNIVYNPNVIVYHPVSLSRQNNDFVNKRLFTEGLTKIYIKRLKNDSLSFRIFNVLKSLFQFICTFFHLYDSSYTHEERSIIRGKLTGLIKSIKELSE